MTLRDIGILLGYDIDENSERKAEDSIQSLKSLATKLLGAIGIGFSLTQMNALAEEFNGINDKIISIGAHAGSSVTRKTNYLICGEKPGSKLTKARSLGFRF